MQTFFNKNIILKQALKEYYIYLLNNEIYSNKSIDYVFEIIDSLNIEIKYLNNFTLDNNLKTDGVYLPNQKSIILNINPLLVSYHLKQLTKEQLILEYFTLLFHEINHTLQYKYQQEIKDDISNILNESNYLKTISLEKRRYLHDLFPDEIDSHLTSISFLYNFFQTNKELNINIKDIEPRIIYFLTLGIINKNIIINSQLNYLYKYLLNISYNKKYDNLSELDHIYYGLTKNTETMNNIIRSYKTKKLYLKLKKEG